MTGLTSSASWASWTAVAAGKRLQPLAAIRAEVSRGGYRNPRHFASHWSGAIWAIEGATGLGASLTARLAADGADVAGVPAKLARRVRMLSAGHGRKTDQAEPCRPAVPRTPPPDSAPPSSTRPSRPCVS